MADSNKTERATPRQRKKARERRQVLRSRELSSALSLSAVAGVIVMMGRAAAPQWSQFFRKILDLGSSDTIKPGGAVLFWTTTEVLRTITPILIVGAAVSVVSGLAQGGFAFAPAALSFKIERISPVSRLRQLFSPSALSTALKSLLPFTAIAWVGFAGIRSHWEDIMASSYISTSRFPQMIAGILIEIIWKSSLIFLIWAGIDYMLLWLKNEGEMKMSHQDIRDEMKQTEGNPESRARVRKLQRQSRRRQMLKAAEAATVVITNPTHYAVALRYEVTMAAPVVVAKGLDNLAARIREIAWKRDVPVMENRPLAQALYRTAEVGDPIPAALYHAVAEILLMIYKVQAEVRSREAQKQTSRIDKNLTRTQ